ncbi:hypothetical protein Tco_0343401 [Tanacetum coccineum]
MFNLKCGDALPFIQQIRIVEKGCSNSMLLVEEYSQEVLDFRCPLLTTILLLLDFLCMRGEVRCRTSYSVGGLCLNLPPPVLRGPSDFPPLKSDAFDNNRDEPVSLPVFNATITTIPPRPLRGERDNYHFSIVHFSYNDHYSPQHHGDLYYHGGTSKSALSCLKPNKSNRIVCYATSYDTSQKVEIPEVDLKSLPSPDNPPM